MRVSFDSRPASDPRGIGRYSRCLLEALRETTPEGDELTETHRPRRADVYHSPWIDGALLRSPCPMVVTLHDVVPLKRRSEYLRTGARMRMRYLAVQRAVRIIVPTQTVAEDAVERLDLRRDRVVVIAEAAARSMYPRSAEEVADVRERYSLPEHYLVWVGGLEHPDPRKHVTQLAAAPRELPLVLVGATRPWAHELPGVQLTGRVPDDDLAAIYTAAHALVFPSDDEGFGLPTVEALACGTPVVACEVPALREVLGDRATLVPCGDMETLMAAAHRAHRPAPAPPPWSWTDAAHATWDVYASAMHQRGDARSWNRRARRRLPREA
ncbi:MAG TPA: glycosyltransferase family 1 protein [Solirubrobacteraceae bacterium]|jgi:glycosyltransferase involved in cell wall biosynthesis|nr:glycosyltransferase family 1 protein [Solirubrobacteraceae bacterium]